MKIVESKIQLKLFEYYVKYKVKILNKNDKYKKNKKSKKIEKIIKEDKLKFIS